MSLAEEINRMLDLNAADSGARLLWAEWLEERGDERGVGYRWLAETDKHPYLAHSTWDWWSEHSVNSNAIRLPHELWLKLPTAPASGFPRCKEWPSRRDAEDAVALTLVASSESAIRE
jgi:hypothetical protein